MNPLLPFWLSSRSAAACPERKSNGEGSAFRLCSSGCHPRRGSAVALPIAAAILTLFTLPAHAEYQQINLTVFGMDCAPCAHAIHVSMKGIQGVDKVDVDLNTGLVAIQLAPGNAASMRQFNQAVEKNGFTHKDAIVTARGKLTGTAEAPIFEVSGTQDRFALVPAAGGADIAPGIASLLGKTVTIQGTLPQAAKGKIADTLRYTTLTEAQ